MKAEHKRLLYIAVADAVIALILAAVVLVLLLTDPADKFEKSKNPVGQSVSAQTSTEAPAQTTAAKTAAPTQAPTAAPTEAPVETAAPTEAPEPTQAPTEAPSPTPAETPAPTESPKPSPTPGVPHLAVAEGLSVSYLDQIESGKVTGNDVNLRAKPESGTKILGTYNSGTKVQIYGASGRWYLVKIGNQEGFMSVNYITLD